MSERDAAQADVAPIAPDGTMAESAQPVPRQRATQRFGTIVVVGGGCYGSYYVRQLGRARGAGALDWQRLIVVDRDARCRVAAEPQPEMLELVVSAWDAYFAGYLDSASENAATASGDAIVPSPLMPHLLFDWLLGRAKWRYPERRVEARPLRAVPAVPWQRASPGGETHYVSFAEWMCPINCIEPLRCPATRGARDWSMPAAVRAHVEGERAAGHILEGPFVFHCAHRAYGVGMIDVRDVIAADRQLADVAERGPADFLVGTVSHCHGALGVLSVGS